MLCAAWRWRHPLGCQPGDQGLRNSQDALLLHVWGTPRAVYFGQVRVSTRLLSRQTGLPLKDSQGRQSSSPPDPWSLPQTYKDPSVHTVDTELLPMHIWELRRQPPELPPRGRRGDRESVRVEGSRWHLSVLGTAPLGQPAAGLSGTGAECPASAHSPKGSLYLTPASSLSFPLPLNFSAVTCAKF